MLKTIVTSEQGRRIAEAYGVTTIDTLTGFKYIGEKIKEYETKGQYTFLFGYEESYGYLVGDFVRDKDAVQACLLISEMTAYYKSQGLTLYEALIQLYDKYGYFQEDLVSITLKGIEGIEKINRITFALRNNPIQEVSNYKVKRLSDYLTGITLNLENNMTTAIDLDKSNVLRYTLEDGSWFAVRPSGTEPKLKIYFSVVADQLERCEEKLVEIKERVLSRIHNIN